MDEVLEPVLEMVFLRGLLEGEPPVENRENPKSMFTGSLPLAKLELLAKPCGTFQSKTVAQIWHFHSRPQ